MVADRGQVPTASRVVAAALGGLLLWPGALWIRGGMLRGDGAVVSGMALIIGGYLLTAAISGRSTPIGRPPADANRPRR
jgi:hypothetical protein